MEKISLEVKVKGSPAQPACSIQREAFPVKRYAKATPAVDPHRRVLLILLSSGKPPSLTMSATAERGASLPASARLPS